MTALSSVALPHLSQWRYTDSVVSADQPRRYSRGNNNPAIHRERTLSANRDTKPGSDPFRFVLRHETRAEHDGLDRHRAFAGLLDGTISLEGYRNLMRAFHGFYLGVDEPLRRACGSHGLDRFGFAYQARTPILASDLAVLGEDARQPAVRPLPGQKLLLDSVEALGGALYVLEGSLLGASILCASTDALLEKTGSAGNGYWKWCSEAAAMRWAMTCKLIEALATTGHAKSGMVDGARTAFRSFAEWLDHFDEDLFARRREPC